MDGGQFFVTANSCNTIQTLLDINAMIDIHAKHLEGLRTQCSTSAELIQQEIRTIEVIAQSHLNLKNTKLTHD